jgi:hypothetical protein
VLYYYNSPSPTYRGRVVGRVLCNTADFSGKGALYDCGRFREGCALCASTFISTTAALLLHALWTPLTPCCTSTSTATSTSTSTSTSTPTELVPVCRELGVGIVVRRCACILLLEYPPSPTYLPTYRPTTLAGLLPFVPRRAVRRAALRRGHEGRCTLHSTTTLRLHLPIYYLPVLRSIADMKVGALCTPLLHFAFTYLFTTYPSSAPLRT